MNSACNQLRHQSFQLAVSDQRIAADKRQMEGLQSIHAFQNAVDQLLPGPVLQSAESHSAPKVGVVVRV